MDHERRADRVTDEQIARWQGLQAIVVAAEERPDAGEHAHRLWPKIIGQRSRGGPVRSLAEPRIVEVGALMLGDGGSLLEKNCRAPSQIVLRHARPRTEV